MVSSNVEPSGRVTKEGKPIYQAKKTVTDVKREASEQRVQRYSGGKKISDTSKVQLPSGEWTTPEKALAVSKEGSAIVIEAKGKIERRKQLESTIRARFEREAREARTETERLQAEKKGIKLITPDVDRPLTLGEKVRLSLFEKQALVRLKERPEAQAVVTEEGFIVAPPSTTIFPEEIPRLRKRKELFERRKLVEPEPSPALEVGLKPVTQQLIEREVDVTPIKLGLPEDVKRGTAYPLKLAKWAFWTAPKQFAVSVTPEPVKKKLISLWGKTEVIPEWTKEHMPSLRDAPTYYKEAGELLKETKGFGGFLAQQQLTTAKYAEPYLGEYLIGGYTGVREEPRKALAYTAAFVALPFVLKDVGGAIYADPLLRTTTQILTPTVAGVVAGSYIKGVKERLKEAERPFFEAGKITTTEIVPMVVGGAIGIKLSNILEGRIRTRGLKEVPTEQIVEPEVIRGEKMFPTSTRKHLKLFKESKFKLVKMEERLGVWHAATSTKETGFSQVIRTELGKTGLVGVGSEYLPGGFVSPSLSPYFLKVSGSPYTFMGTDLFPGTPTVAYIYPKGIKQYKGRTVRGMWDFLFDKAKKGWVYTHRVSIKTEVEGLVPPGTPIRGIDKRFYVKWKGVRIPIVEFTTKIGGVKPGRITTIGALPTAYVKPSIISPLGVGILDILSKGKEYGVSEVSSRISSKVSSLISMDYSKLSSRISERVTEKPSRVSRVSKISSRISGLSSSIIGGSSIVSRISERPYKPYRPYRPYEPPYEPPPSLIPKLPKLYWGIPKEKGELPFGEEFAFTPDFIASVRREFAPQPRQRRFTGQERRFIPLTGRFVSPLPKKGIRGIFGLIRKQLEA